MILITDGLETCNADPCALARELEATGADFTTHVIGFGLSPEEGQQVACLADETGGVYLQAADAGALLDALASTVAEASMPTPTAPAEVEMAAAELPTATLDAPAEVTIGAEFGRLGRTWRGSRPRLALRSPPTTAQATWCADAACRPAPTSPTAGWRSSRRPRRALELHYHYGPQAAVIPVRPIAIVPAAVSLDAPPACRSAAFTAAWSVPAAIAIVDLFDEASGDDRHGTAPSLRLRQPPGAAHRSREGGFLPGGYVTRRPRILAATAIETAKRCRQHPKALPRARCQVVGKAPPTRPGGDFRSANKLLATSA